LPEDFTFGLFRPGPFRVLTKAGGIYMSARVVLKPSASLAVEWFKPHICGNQDHSRVKYSFSYTCVIILVTTLRTMSGRGPKPCMDLDFTHAIKTSGTTRKITRVCAVVTGRYCMCMFVAMDTQFTGANLHKSHRLTK